ncbi:MAG: hypothetical protein J1E65_07090, partial [Lachnospiraceae bacterium]|nr:hypothetical protein [Lachnospiraceae bacterium]
PETEAAPVAESVPTPVPEAEAAPAAEPVPTPAPVPVQPTGYMQGVAPAPTQPGQAANFAQNQMPVPPTPIYAQPVGAVPPAVPAEVGGKKKKGKAGLVILLVILVLLLAGGGALAFLFLNSNPAKKIDKALEAGNIETVIELYGELSGDKDKEEVSQKLLAYAEQVRDDYFNEKKGQDYESTIEVLNLLADASLETDDEIEDIRAFVNRIYASREAFAAGEDYRASGEYVLALEKYDDVIAEDTRYYDKAQTAFEETKQELINATLNEAYALMNSGDYLAADNLLNEVNLAIPGGGSSELADAHLTVQAAMEDKLVSEVIEDANVAVADGRISDAQQMLEDMLEVYPDNVQLQNALAGLPTDGTLVGTWILECDIQSLVVEELGDDFADFDSPLVVPLMFEFNEDGTFRMYMGEDFKDNFDNWLEDFIVFTTDYLYDMLASEGMSRAEADEIIQMIYGSSLEDYLRDELAYQLDFAMEDLEEVMGMEESALYEVQGNKIYLSDEYGVMDYSSYETFEVYGNMLILSNENGSTEEIFPGTGIHYPLTFYRVTGNY